MLNRRRDFAQHDELRDDRLAPLLLRSGRDLEDLEPVDAARTVHAEVLHRALVHVDGPLAEGCAVPSNQELGDPMVCLEQIAVFGNDGVVAGNDAYLHDASVGGNGELKSRRKEIVTALLRHAVSSRSSTRFAGTAPSASNALDTPTIAGVRRERIDERTRAGLRVRALRIDRICTESHVERCSGDAGAFEAAHPIMARATAARGRSHRRFATTQHWDVAASARIIRGRRSGVGEAGTVWRWMVVRKSDFKVLLRSVRQSSLELVA